MAVRIFHEQVAGDADFARRFEQQAQAVAALEHPHIAPVYDYWREPGRAYIVSRYLKGGSLQALHDRGSDARPADRRADRRSGRLGARIRPPQGIAHGDCQLGQRALRRRGQCLSRRLRRRASWSAATSGQTCGDWPTLATALLPGNVRLRELAGRLDGADASRGRGLRGRRHAGRSTAPERRRRGADARNPYKGLRPSWRPTRATSSAAASSADASSSGWPSTARDARFLAVVGPSGAGKSSVVRAGLVPEIRRGALGPGRDELRGRDAARQPPHGRARGRLQRSPSARSATCATCSTPARAGSSTRSMPCSSPRHELTLVVDQFEETFTSTDDEAEREAFLESLRVAAVDPDSRVRIVVTMRADFYDRPLHLPALRRAVRRANRGGRAADARRAGGGHPPAGRGGRVTRRARAGGRDDRRRRPSAGRPAARPVRLDRDVRAPGRRAADPRHLPAHRRHRRRALGARRPHLRGHRPRPGQRATKQVFLRLVTLGEGQQDTADASCAASWTHSRSSRGAIDDVVLDAFGRHRLLTFDREPATREPTVEIAHEALLTAWQRLRGWIEGAREDLRQERRVARAAAEWRASERDPSFLMRGVRLEQVAAWAEATDLAIGTPERAYLKASLDERDEEQREQEAAGRARGAARASVAVPPARPGRRPGGGHHRGHLADAVRGGTGAEGHREAARGARAGTGRRRAGRARGSIPERSHPAGDRGGRGGAPRGATGRRPARGDRGASPGDRRLPRRPDRGRDRRPRGMGRGRPDGDPGRRHARVRRPAGRDVGRHRPHHRCPSWRRSPTSPSAPMVTG